MPWPALKPATERARNKSGHVPIRILERSGALVRSILADWSPPEAVAGTNLVYAAIHQFEGKIGKQARSQTLAFRARGGATPGGGFASRRSTRRRKGAVRVAFASIGAHVVEMPARPFLDA